MVSDRFISHEKEHQEAAQYRVRKGNFMIKLRLVRLMAATLYYFFGIVLVLYFTIVGLVGVFVISQTFMGKICENYGEVSDTMFFTINIIIASFWGMLPFGLLAAKSIPVFLKNGIFQQFKMH